MVTLKDIIEVQKVIDYNFKSVSLLKLALTAAGADDENHDGNRKLAQLGESLIEFLLSFNAFMAGLSRADVSKHVTSAAARKNRENVAKSTGIAAFIRCSPRQRGQPPSQATMSLTISAIICACWLDSDQNHAVIYRVMCRLGILLPREPCVGPEELSVQQQNSWWTDSQTCELSPSQGPSNSDCNTHNTQGPFHFHLWITESSPSFSNASDIARFFANGCLDNAELMETESLDNAVHRPMSMEESLFERDFRNLSQSPCLATTQSDTESFPSVVQDLPTRDLARVRVRLRNHELERFRNCEDETAEDAESEDVRMQTAAGQTIYKYVSGNTFQYQHAAAKSSLHVADTRIEIVTSTVARSSQSPLGSPVTAETSSRNPLLSIQQRADSIQGRRTSITRTALKRRRFNGESSYETITAALEPYFSQERMKCERLGLRFPDDHTKDRQIRDSLMKLSLDADVNILRCFALIIGSCESLVVLKDILQAYRSSGHVFLLQTAQKIPNARRLEIIRSLGRNEAYFNLLRKCHVHKLFTENTGFFRNVNDKFIVNTTESIASRARRHFGNPLNVAEAEITKAMMKEIYPNVSLNNTDYDTKYREISNLRRLGRRLDILVSIFGLGILGLLPLRKDDSITGLASSFTDNLISTLPEDKLKNIMIFLDQYEGHVLRKISNAATQIVEGVFQRTIDSSEAFVLENIEREQMMEYSKGSHQVMELLSRVSISLPVAD